MNTRTTGQSHFIPLDGLSYRDIIYDIDFTTVQKWKEQHGDKKVVGTFPVYIPQELIHAFGHLPVNLLGGGEQINISHADAILGSFICSISKSTTELLLHNETLRDNFDGFVFPFICDVARNLSGIFDRRFDKPVYMLHMAQNYASRGAIEFLTMEYRRMIDTLFPDETLDIEALRDSIRVFNTNRQLQREIYAFRSKEPWNVPLKELYQLMRLGSVIPVEQHNELLKEGLDRFKKNNRVQRDAVRVVVTGNFCEQPPQDVIDLIEQVGNYVIDDDFMIGRRYVVDDVNPDAEDPVQALAEAYIHRGAKLATRFHEGEKGDEILRRVEEANAQGVIFLTAKFCEPALDDLVLQQFALSDNDIQSVHVEFEERGSGYENIRLSLETFVESMLFD